MTRKEQIRDAAIYYDTGDMRDSFIEGAQWADENPKSPWISVEDRLPDRHPAKFINWSKKVLVVVKRGRECCTYIDEYSHIYNTWRVFGDKVTHWMPIPELPKEERK